MARTMIIVVSEDHQMIENVRAFGHSRGAEVQAYSSAEWQARHEHQQQSSPLTPGHAPVESGAKILPFPGGPVSSSIDARTGRRVQTINELESHAIEKAIMEYNGNLTEAAKALGIGRATLYRKVKQYNIDPSVARRKRAA